MPTIETLAAADYAAPRNPNLKTADHLAALANTPAGRKLRQAAGEFESMLISSLWKSMKSSFADSGEESIDPAHDSLEDWSMQTMSCALGKAGGIGLGNMILKHLMPKMEDTSKSDGTSVKPRSAAADI